MARQTDWPISCDRREGGDPALKTGGAATRSFLLTTKHTKDTKKRIKIDWLCSLLMVLFTFFRVIRVFRGCPLLQGGNHFGLGCQRQG
jgi:hypothetical protein